jgi:hypothetical protein
MPRERTVAGQPRAPVTPPMLDRLCHLAGYLMKSPRRSGSFSTAKLTAKPKANAFA